MHGSPAFVIGISFGIALWDHRSNPAYNLTDVVACIVSMGAAGALPALLETARRRRRA